MYLINAIQVNQINITMQNWRSQGNDQSKSSVSQLEPDFESLISEKKNDSRFTKPTVHEICCPLLNNFVTNATA